MATVAYTKVGGHIIHLTGRADPSDEDWQGYLKFVKGALVPGKGPTVLAFSFGGVPNVAQRQRLNALAEQGTVGLRVAVVTASALGRGVVTALSWFAKDGYRAFSPQDLDAAITYIGAPRALFAEIKSTMSTLAKQVGIPDATFH
jgi:hypothetical protein